MVIQGKRAIAYFDILGFKANVNGKIKYTNFGHEKYTTLRH